MCRRLSHRDGVGPGLKKPVDSVLACLMKLRYDLVLTGMQYEHLTDLPYFITAWIFIAYGPSSSRPLGTDVTDRPLSWSGARDTASDKAAWRGGGGMVTAMYEYIRFRALVTAASLRPLHYCLDHLVMSY
ncbi:hypothetical protein GQ602_006845 [Ophiocordyceps camponoti-floridani]|uniref:Uncharacterized protein n=1 Tax=Ophiocordyceps camponoti-floridani TaxID=2030778 RepID=A0A8H4Q256_9HYPO|nr:hypothetical protein GQ602_006845 [Ophiocordyceps camponoti-floridani]